jgi:hypothetical protein
VRGVMQQLEANFVNVQLSSSAIDSAYTLFVATVLPQPPNTVAALSCVRLRVNRRAK